jgi:hypothetical protein
MLGVILLPETYGGRVLGPQTKHIVATAAASLASEIGGIGASPAGQFALRMYEKYRLL